MDTSGGSGHSSDPPSSPWAQRFPIDGSTFIVGNTQHSLFAPQFPRINDPKHYDQDPDQSKFQRPQTYKEIDSLLWSEKIQQRTFWGARTFQLAALNRRLMFSTSDGLVSVAGAHRRSLVDKLRALFPQLHISPKKSATKSATSSYQETDDFQMYRRERIKVDQKKWFAFLRKDRWFDWIQFNPDAARSKPNRTWSVDDAEIWDALSVSLELVNFILRALIDEKHDGVSGISLKAAHYWSNFEDIFGEPPAENASVLLSHSMEQTICEKRGTNICEFEQTVNQTVEESEQRLKNLLSNMIWGFEENRGSHAVTRAKPSVGLTNDIYGSVISISTHKLEALLNPDLTLGEFCQLQVDLAITMVHELMHAILFARNVNDTYVGNLLDKERSGRLPEEPYLDAEGFAEAGFYMEQSIFGGVHELIPILPDRHQPPPLAEVLLEWPYASYGSEESPAGWNKAFLEDGALTTIYHVPSVWSSKLLTASFWNDPAYLRKSDNFFHNSRIFKMTAPIKNRKTGECTSPLAVRVPNQPGQPYHYPENQKVADDWFHQGELWNSLRDPWYQNTFKEWEISPWSYMKERLLIDAFARAFARKDHIQCAQIADGFVYKVDWTNGHSKYKKSMPTAVDASPLWIWHAIGLLMLASIPIRRQTLTQKEASHDWLIELVPSKEAAADGHDLTVYIHPDLAPPHKSSVSPSRFYNYAKRGGGRVRDFTQLNYLQLIVDMIKLIAGLGSVVHIKFLDGIIDAEQALLADRKKLAASYPGISHSTRWASKWVFEFPVYDPNTCSFVRSRWKKR
ncbi:hypothetical protein F4782DRAFT_547587 [Xylaria castorea]|nr:hypothetical protein F4782DRAFT_547587 [Xylaria castorea]